MEFNEKNQREDYLCLQEGRTITELLISMSLTFLLFAILIHSQILIKQRLEKLKIEQQLQAEAAAFFHYLESEMDNTARVYISTSSIFFFSQGERLDYRKSGDKIIREKNGTGYVPVCMYVKSFQSHLAHQGIVIQLILEKNDIEQLIETEVHYYLTG